MEVDVWQIGITLALTLIAFLGAVTRYVRGAIKAQEAVRAVEVDDLRKERTEEIANKQQKFESNLDLKRREMEARILSEQANSEQALAFASALETMAGAFKDLSKSIRQSNEMNEEWRNTFSSNHQDTVGLIEATSENAGHERQMQINLLQQILTAVSANGGVGHGDKAVSFMLEFPPG